MTLKRIVTVVLALVALCAASASAQGINGSFVGGVTDQTGAIVLDASVKATNTDTGVAYAARTTSGGRYALPALPAGTYLVEVSKNGFKTAAATNIQLSMQQTVTLDFKLEVGTASTTVTVTTEAPLIDDSTAEVGDSMDDKLFHELPIMMQGAVLDPQTFIYQSLPGTVGNGWQGTINGGQQMATDVLIDGLSLGRFDINGDLTENTPSVEAMGEFKLLANNYSAEFGGTSTGIESFEMKSGTNEYHGGLWEYHRNKVLDARGWSVNTYAPYGTNAAGGANKAPDIQNDFGGAFGGPIWIPKIYNGHKKTFFYYVYDHVHVSDPAVTSRASMPDPLELQGNMTETLGPQIGTDALNRPIYQGEIYDPATTRTVNGNIIRDAFGFDPNSGLPGPMANIIPTSRFSTVTNAILSYVKGFSYTSPNPGPWNNVAVLAQSPFFFSDQTSIKIDHSINDKHKLSGFYNYSFESETPLNGGTIVTTNYFNPISRGNNETPKTYLARLSEDWTINDHTLNHAAVGFNRWYNPNHSASYGEKNWSQALGLPGTSPLDFPAISFESAGGYGIDGFGDGALTTEISESYTYADDLTYSRGKHEWKFGAELRRYRLNNVTQAIGTANFSFYNGETALPGYLNASNNANGVFQTGFPWASFLLGEPDSENNIYQPFTTGTRAGLVAFFAQDDWRVLPRLSLNLGLRWDIPIPRTEAHDIQCNFDATLPNPDASGALGAMQYLKSTGRHSIQDHYLKDVAPRVGFNFQLDKKTVVRGGYGISFSAPVLNDFGDENSQGYSGNLSLNHSNPDPRLPNPGGNSWDLVSDWDLGVPAFTQTLPVTDPGFADFDQQGGGANYLRPNSLRGPYTQQWSLGFQRDIGWESALEVNYIGTKGSRLWSQGWTLNNPNPKYMAMEDPATGDSLLSSFTYSQLSPADWAVLQSYGVNGLPYASFPTWAGLGQGLSRWPQMSGVNDVASNWGDSHYNSLQVSWKKRPAKDGLTVLANYTYSKLITNSENACCGGAGGAGGVTQWANWNNRLERSVSDLDYTDLAKLTWVYELPFGSGRQLVNRHGFVNQLVGGWSITAVQNYGSGDPLEVDSQGLRADAIGNIKSAIGHAKGALNPNGSPYLNVPTTFDANGCKGPFCLIPTTADGYALRPGTSSRFYGQLRGPWQPTETAGVIKEFHFSEMRYLQLRAHFFNMFNRTGRGDPDTNLQDSTFGQIMNPWGNPRSIQVVGHLYF